MPRKRSAEEGAAFGDSAAALRFTLLRETVAQGPVSIHVVGDCMSPALRDGVTVQVERGFYLPGDVMTVRRSDDSLVSHRLLGYAFNRKLDLCFLLAADSASTADPPVPLGRVLGRVAAIDDRSFSPTARDRARAALRWFPALFGLLRSRF